MLRAGAVIAAFIGLWYVVGTVAGILWTRRALVVAGVLAAVGVAGFWVPWGLDLMLLADVVLVALIWLDATLAQHVAVARDPLPAFSVGHAGEVTYRWTNPSSRRARLLIREVRPDILGGARPARTRPPPHAGAAPLGSRRVSAARFGAPARVGGRSVATARRGTESDSAAGRGAAVRIAA